MLVRANPPADVNDRARARGPSIVPRAALYSLLEDRIAGTGVVLVSAPAGSGKTILVRAWVDAQEQTARATWVSVERGETSAQHFWQCVAEALQRTLDTDRLKLTPTPDFDGTAVVARLLSVLGALDEPMVLVIDDLHELKSSEAIGQLELLVAKRPPLVTLVLCTRHDLRIGLHRLRLTGELTEVRAIDLRFSLAETRELLLASGVQLSDESVRILHRRTEGWAAGLRLAALSLARHPDPERFVAEFSGSERTVADYLLAEVLERQAEPVRSLLLRTSILDRVNGELADMLVGAPGSEAILQQLEDDNALVVSIDAGRSWFRYHQLLADLLQLELRKRAREEVRPLHLTASAWFSEHGFPLDAVRHAQAAREWSLASRLLSDSWFGLYLDGRAESAYQYLSAFPPELVATDPELTALLAARELNEGSLELAGEHLAMAAEKADTAAGDRRERLEVVLVVLRLTLHRQRGDVPAAIEEARRASELAAAADAGGPGLGDDLRALALLNLGFAEVGAFQIDEAERLLEQGLAAARRRHRPFLELAALSRLAATASFHSPAASIALGREAIALAEANGWSTSPVIALAYWAQAICMVWQGRLEEAETLLDLAEQGQRPEVEPATAIAVLHARAMVDLLQGRDSAALDKLRAGERLARELGPGQVLATMIRRWLLPTLARRGQGDEVEHAFAQLGEAERGDAQMRIALAWVRVIQQDPAAATAVLAPVIAGDVPVASAGVDGLHAFLLEAIARDMLGDARASTRALERALDLAEADGMRWAFLLHPIPDLLERHRKSGTVHEALVADLLDLISPGPGRARGVEMGELQEQLTDSELRVLRFLPSNLPAPEIAAELFLSTSTVKTHMRHIYAKLEVHGRSQAVARARALGLLPPLATLRR